MVRDLTREIETRWNLHRWDLPSRVYARPLPLYPGRDVRSLDLPSTLDALGYRPADDTPDPPPPGVYRHEPGRLVVHLHDFRYPEPRGLFRGFPLAIDIEDGRIARMRNLRSGASVEEVELEPLEVASIFDARVVDRTPVTLDEVPEPLIRAVLSVEDQRFFEHEGLDPVRIVGAAVQNLRRGRLAQGGSTLTQQLVKNLYLTPEKSFRRKVREAVMALVLDLRYEKREILEAYLNEVYLGRAGPSSIVGVGQASRFYFSKNVSQLSLAESALLAGMIRSPNLTAPGRHPDAARARRALVLRLMERQGWIPASEREAAAAEPLPDPAPGRDLNSAPWFVDHVRRELGERFPSEALEREGFRIFTTLDPRAQDAAEAAVREGVETLKAEHPWLRGEGDAAEEERAPVQAALVAMDPRTGELRAMVGGDSYARTQFNRAVQARRQPGSLFKPFVYLAALADSAGRYTLSSRVPDTTFTVPASEAAGEPWSPANADGREHGEVSLREALVHSYNIATARLALDVGLPAVLETARGLGLAGRMRPVPSAALGAFEVTPLEMASAYSALAGGGVRADPLSVLRVVSPEGRVLRADDLRVRRVAPPGPVYLVNRTLQEVLLEGTAAAARRLGYEGRAAGKTGTTSGYRDGWFVGYTPELVVLVWVGFDDNRSLRLEGARVALPLWIEFMERYAADESPGFPPPDGIVRMAVDSATGKRADPDCGPSRMTLFLEGTEPTESCDEGSWWIF